MELNGRWKVSSLPFNGDISAILREDFVPEGWLTAQIPEDIHATLRRAGAIRGNTYDKRETEEAWIEEYDWVYYKEFYAGAALAGRRLTLRFEGLDTFCEIYLNGQKIGAHCNMHTPCEIDATGSVRIGARNVLIVRFFSPVQSVAHCDQRNIFSITTSERIFARKAQMNYSWDFCGRCVTVGIWKPVCLLARDEARIESYYLYTLSANEEAAQLGLEVAIDFADASAAPEAYVLEAELSLDGRSVYRYAGPPAEFGALHIDLARPALWWPRPYGEQPLYDFRLTLLKGDVPVCEKTQRVGVRTIEVLQQPQSDGISFQFAVNGRPLFLRGANWVPINTVYTDIRRSDYERLIHFAVHGRISMLRIWGGGIYESPALFELCDQHGILLWNDFMFACGIYPRDEAFLSEVACEAEYVLKTYRNYTCLALWAGDNENGQAYIWANRAYEFEQDPINTRVLRDACARLDPHRFYLTTSPGSPFPNARGGDNPESPHQGDLHLYIMSANPGVTEWRDYGHDYYKRVLGYRPRFMSEFGFVSLPGRDSYYRFNPRREPLRNPSEIIKFLPFTREYLEAGDVDSVIYYSQVFNALALKYWIEYFRSLKGTCSGTLYWKFNDPLADCPDMWMYPSQMSSVDMYFNTKMTYYFTRRAYADTLVAFIESPQGLTVWGCTEGLEPLRGTLTLTRRRFDGEILAQRQVDCMLEGDSAAPLCVPDEDFTRAQDRFGEYLKAEWRVGGEVYENRYYFADLCEINRLNLPQGEIDISGAQLCGTRLSFTLTARSYVRSLRLNLPDIPADYSDNHFDLDAGGAQEIEIVLSDDADVLAAALTIEGENLARRLLPLAGLCAQPKNQEEV